MRYKEFITEGLRHPVIVVDVQPEYSGMNDGDESPVFEEIIEFVNKQTGRVLMFVNAEETGISGDSIQGVMDYWNDTVCGYGGEEDRYDYDEETEEYTDKECEDEINWSRFEIVDKGYGYLRGWMDQGIDDRVIIKVIREMYQQRVTDSRMLWDEEGGDEYEQHMTELGLGEISDNISVEWTSVTQLREFSGAYLVGGGRNECLREVELLMNAFNIKYKRIDQLVYG